MATQVVELTGDEAALLRSLDNVIKKQLEYERKLRDSADAGDAAGVALEGALAKVGAESDKAMRGILRDIKALGPEGQAAAEAMKTHFQATGKAGFESMDQMIARLREMDPEAAEAAEKAAANIRHELSRAAPPDGQFAEVLDELRALGPEGRKAADELRRHLVSAGQIAEKSMADIVAELEKISPEAARIGLALKQNIEMGESGFQSFGKTAIGQISAIIGSYVGLSEVMNSINGFLEEQRRLATEAADAQVDLAKAQQEAFKNMVGQTDLAQNALLQKKVFKVAGQEGASSVVMTQAVVAAKSAGATDEEALQSARAAASYNRLSPEQIPKAAKAAVILGQATGVADPRQNLNLLLTSGGPAFIEDPDKLANSAPVAIKNVAGAMDDPDKIRASREAAALFAMMSAKAGDEMGESTVTNAGNFALYLRKFFRDVVPAEQDPKTLFGRLDFLRSEANAELRAEFVDKLPGEGKFKMALEQAVTPKTEAAQMLQQNFETIDMGTQTYDQKVRQSSAGTPQISLAAFRAEMNANIDAAKVSSTDSALAAEIKKLTLDATAQARPESFTDGWLSYTIDSTVSLGKSAADAAVNAVGRMQTQIALLKQDGIQFNDTPKIAQLENAIEGVMRIMERNAQFGDSLDPEATSRARDKAKELAFRNQLAGADPVYERLFTRIAETLDKIQDNSAKVIAPTETTAENTRPKSTSVTPELSSQRP